MVLQVVQHYLAFFLLANLIHRNFRKFLFLFFIVEVKNEKFQDLNFILFYCWTEKMRGNFFLVKKMPQWSRYYNNCHLCFFVVKILLSETAARWSSEEATYFQPATKIWHLEVNSMYTFFLHCQQFGCHAGVNSCIM
jgi:hypothetical protein